MRPLASCLATSTPTVVWRDGSPGGTSEWATDVRVEPSVDAGSSSQARTCHCVGGRASRAADAAAVRIPGRPPQRSMRPMARTTYRRARAALLALAIVAAAAVDTESVTAEPRADRSTSHDGLSIATSEGTIRGRGTEDHRIFEGIPFARPPVGDLRLRAPRPPARWTGVRDARTPGPRCAQVFTYPPGTPPQFTGSEDCLYLNVHVPRGGSVPKPVMVFVHGGGFASGSGAAYDPRRVSGAGDVIVITLNYRLGALGFLRHSALHDPAAGNFGIADQQAALRWVQRTSPRSGATPATSPCGASRPGPTASAPISSRRVRGDRFTEPSCRAARVPTTSSPGGRQSAAATRPHTGGRHIETAWPEPSPPRLTDPSTWRSPTAATSGTPCESIGWGRTPRGSGRGGALVSSAAVPAASAPAPGTGQGPARSCAGGRPSAMTLAASRSRSTIGSAAEAGRHGRRSIEGPGFLLDSQSSRAWRRSTGVVGPSRPGEGAGCSRVSIPVASWVRAPVS